MKMTHVLAALTLLLATFAMHSEATATYSKQTYEGQVINITHDEEGASIEMMIKGGTKSFYVPRSVHNESLMQKAFESKHSKTKFKVKL